MKTVLSILAIAALAACPSARGAEEAPAPAAGGLPATSCRSCHVSERPVYGSAELEKCLRTLPRGAHAVDEGPEDIRMNENGRHYGAVPFSHRKHAGMADMGQGCRICHHEATEGREMRKCGDCHPGTRKRTELDRPDRQGALHRQCIACHLRWDPGTRCLSCHEGKDRQISRRREPLELPGRMIYETTATNGVLVTFHHGDHSSMFGLSCAQCHQDQSCEECHDRRQAAWETDARGKSRREGDEAHAACKACHEVEAEEACATCHAAEPLEPFTHARAGVELSPDHDDAVCADCHAGSDFKKPPTCDGCHDEDITFPDKLPGKRVGAAAGEPAP